MISFSYLSRVSFMYHIDYRVILAGFVYQSLLCRLGSLRKLWHRDCKTPPEKFESCLLLHHVEWLFPSWKQPHLFLQLSFFKDILQVFADSRNSDVKQFSHRLLGSPNVFVLVEYLYAILLPFGNKCKEFCRTVPYLEFFSQNYCTISHKCKDMENPPDS